MLADYNFERQFSIDAIKLKVSESMFLMDGQQWVMVVVIMEKN